MTIPPSIRERIAPFLMLLDARYLPVLFASAHQSYTVGLWLWHTSDGTMLAGLFAVLGAIGYEFVYVGSFAWAELGAGWRYARVPAVTSLIFAVAVAFAYYAPAYGMLALLHAGFPLVAYGFTMLMHAPRQTTPPLLDRMVETVIRLRQARETIRMAADTRTVPEYVREVSRLLPGVSDERLGGLLGIDPKTVRSYLGRSGSSPGDLPSLPVPESTPTVLNGRAK